jgi:hypothetical protein
MTAQHGSEELELYHRFPAGACRNRRAKALGNGSFSASNAFLSPAAVTNVQKLSIAAKI